MLLILLVSRKERARDAACRHSVRLVRRYRAGELPDVRGVSTASLIDPLTVLALRDDAVAAALLSALADISLLRSQVTTSRRRNSTADGWAIVSPAAGTIVTTDGGVAVRVIVDATGVGAGGPNPDEPPPSLSMALAAR